MVSYTFNKLDVNDYNKIIEKIVKNKLKFPDNLRVSECAYKLLKKCLIKSEALRIEINDKIFDEWYNDTYYLKYKKYFRNCSDKVNYVKENNFKQKNSVNIDRYKGSPLKNLSNDEEKFSKKSSSLNRRMNTELNSNKSQFKYELYVNIYPYSKSPRNNICKSLTKIFTLKSDDDNSKLNTLKSVYTSKK